jgi:hypothetical protein
VASPEEAKVARMYALRVGIDAYRLPAPPLYGCRNHIAEAARFLRRHAPGSSPAVEELYDQDAARIAVTSTFRWHHGRAGPGGVALFWFSGYGSTILPVITAVPCEP